MASLSSDGYAKSWLDYEKILGQRPILGGSAQGIIDSFNALGAALAASAPPPDTSVFTRDQNADGVPVRIYLPPSASKGTSLPVGVFYHSGGYLVGGLDSEDAFCRYFAKMTPCVIVSVDYRLSMEAKMPAAFEDSMKAYKWVYNNISVLGGEKSRIFTIGGSAGGGLALTVCDQLIKSGHRDQCCGVVSMVPVTAHPEAVPEEYKSEYTAYKDNASGVPVIDADSMRIFFEAAGITTSKEFNDPKIFAMLSKDLAKFPPTYIATCGKDPLRDDGKVLEMKLKKEGVKVKRNHYEGVPHYFWLFPGIEGVVEFLNDVVEGIKFVLER